MGGVYLAQKYNKGYIQIIFDSTGVYLALSVYLIIRYDMVDKIKKKTFYS